MNPFRSTHRPSRFVAGVLLLILHVVAIELLVSLHSARDRPVDEVVTSLLSVFAKTEKPRPTLAQPPLPRKSTSARPARTAIAQSIPDSPERLHDSSVPVAIPDPGTTPPDLPGAQAGTANQPRLDLSVPKEFFTHPPPLTVAQEAMLDPRSNRLVLTRREQIELDFGQIECIAWLREPDGSIYRGPGHLKRVQDVGTNPFTFHARGREDRHEECVK